jgi:hypothetical protein
MARRWHARELAQVAFIAVLAVSAIVTGRNVEELKQSRAELVREVQDARSDGRTNAAAVEAIEAILADVCQATPDQQLDDAGVARECTLAEAGNIEDRLPVVKTPAAPREPGVSVAQIEGVVDAYLRRYLSDLPADYTAELRAQVVEYLQTHPGEPGQRGQRGRRGAPGRPGPVVSTAAVAAATAAYLQANPPPPGEPGAPGAPGVGVSSAFLDGCDVVFTYTDGTSSRVGPLCGPPGPPGPQGEQGVPGERGEPGRGIAAMECIDENPEDPASRWRITYTDGQVQEDAGPCRGPRGERGEPGPPGPTPTPTATEPTPTSSEPALENP